MIHHVELAKLYWSGYYLKTFTRLSGFDDNLEFNLCLIMKKINEKKLTLFQKVEKTHPHLIFLYLALIGSSVLFLFLVLNFVANLQTKTSFQIPFFFVLSSILVLLCSFFVDKTKENFEKDEQDLLRKNLGLTLLFGLGFVFSQFLAWQELEGLGIIFKGKATESYIYLITALHFLHLLLGLVFTSLAFGKITKNHQDPVEMLLLFSNKYEGIKLQMLRNYWHFLDGIWIIIFISLLIYHYH